MMRNYVKGVNVVILQHLWESNFPHSSGFMLLFLVNTQLRLSWKVYINHHLC